MATKTFVSFLLENQLFGLDIRLIREINKHLDLTPVPHAANYIRGLVNLRGQIVTVLDLKSRLGLGNAELNDLSHNIILKTESELTETGGEEDLENLATAVDKASFLVDNIGDVIAVEPSEIEPPPANIGAVDGKYLLGVVKLENTLVGILSAPKILNQKSD